MKITRIESFRHKLGEGPLWDPVEGVLYGADVLGRQLWRYDPARGDYDTWTFSGTVSALALRARGGAIVATSGGLQFFDFTTAKPTLIENVCARDPMLLLNDGKVDAAGRFIVGDVYKSGEKAEASLYSVDINAGVRVLDSDYIVSNGPCWSPNGAVFYCAETVRGDIYTYDYDTRHGTVSGRRLFTNTLALGGSPDGTTVDADGCLWTALCGGSKVVRYRSDGAPTMTIDLPTQLVSSVMFGGPDLDRLFVTSIDGAAAAREIEMAAKNPAPHDDNSGALFVIDGLGITGVPERRFAG
jgi:L-arabinonolactonase